MIRRSKHRLGMSLVEIMIASLLSVLIAGGVMGTFITVIKQTRINLASETFRRQANYILDVIATEIRSAQVNEGVNFGSATEIVSGAEIYDSVRYNSGGTVREIRLVDGEVILDPNVSSADDEIVVATDNQIIPHITQLSFYQNYNDIGIMDNTTVTIELTVTDQGQTQEDALRSGGVMEFTASTFVTLRAPS